MKKTIGTLVAGLVMGSALVGSAQPRSAEDAIQSQMYRLSELAVNCGGSENGISKERGTKEVFQFVRYFLTSRDGSIVFNFMDGARTGKKDKKLNLGDEIDFLQRPFNQHYIGGEIGGKWGSKGLTFTDVDKGVKQLERDYAGCMPIS